MKRHPVAMVLACAAVGVPLTVAGPADAGVDLAANRPVTAAGSWHRAIEVPGLGKLNAGGNAGVGSVSCGSAGNCAAGGSYSDASGNFQAFVVSEENDSWGQAIEVPGLGTLNRAGVASLGSVSCGSAGNGAAGGTYGEAPGKFQLFVVGEKNGRWGKAIEVPGSAALNAGGIDGVASVSCGSAGNCAAGGGYKDVAGHREVFVVSEQNGRWGKAIEVPGVGALNVGGVAVGFSVSCASAGECSAGGTYTDRSGSTQGFVVSQT